MLRPDWSLSDPSPSDHAAHSARERGVLVNCRKGPFFHHLTWRTVFLIVHPTPQTNWAFNFLVGEMTPYLQEVIEWRLYPMHGFFCACSFIVGKSS